MDWVRYGRPSTLQKYFYDQQESLRIVKDRGIVKPATQRFIRGKRRALAELVRVFITTEELADDLYETHEDAGIDMSLAEAAMAATEAAGAAASDAGNGNETDLTAETAAADEEAAESWGVDSRGWSAHGRG